MFSSTQRILSSESMVYRFIENSSNCVYKLFSPVIFEVNITTIQYLTYILPVEFYGDTYSWMFTTII